MSAIIGIRRFDGAPVDRATLDRMAAPLRFMGPDGSATTISGPVGMSLHLMHLDMPGRPPERLEAEPAGQVLLAADVRLDNREDLAAALSVSRTVLAEISDSALVLRAYAKWGEACAERLLGDFAFALFDAPRGKLFCARDHFGVRPFFYHHGQDAFAFASAIPALFAAGGPSRDLDPYGVASYLLEGCWCDDLTLYRDIRALDPGHYLVIGDDGRARKSRYWSPDPESELRLSSDEAYIEGFRERLEHAVRARLPASGPVGTTVSGGLDSSVVTAWAARGMENRPLIGVGLLAPGENPPWPDSDWDHAHTLASSLPNLRLHCLSAEGRSPVDGQADYFALHGLPLQNIQHYGWGVLLAEAGRQGCRVMLTGIEGDWGVSKHGEGYIAELVRRGAWRRAVHELRAVRERRAPYYPKGGPGLASHVKGTVLKPLIPQPVWDAIKRLAGRSTWRDRVAHGAWLSREVDLERFAAEIGHHAYWHERADLRRNECSGLLCHARWRKLEEFAAECARFGLAPAFPLMDVRLVEFYLGIPSRLKFADGMGRQVMRRAAAGLIPDTIRQRITKGPFDPNMLRAMLDCLGSITETLRHAAEDEDVASYVDVKKILDFLERRHPREPADLMRVEYLDLVFPGYYMANALRTKGFTQACAGAAKTGRC